MSALYIANLHPNITEAMLYNKFSIVGPVRLVNIGRDVETHQRLGYAYVYFHEAEHAKRSFREMGLDVLHGRPLDIKWPDEVSQPPPIDRPTTTEVVDERQESETSSESSDGQSESTNDGNDNPKDGRGRGPDPDTTCHENRNRPRSVSIRSGISASSGPFSVTNLYIANFSRELDRDGLYDLFRSYGKIVSCEIAKHTNGQSKGHGFCSFRTTDAAEKAIKALNGYVLNGRKLYVGPFISRHERGRQFQGTRRHTDSNPYKFNLYIKNLDESVTNVTLEKEFSKFGHLLNSTVRFDAAGRSQGYGFVAFETKDEMDRAIKEMDGAKLGTKRIDITVAMKP